MKFATIDAARIARDGGIDAMDALNAILAEVEPGLDSAGAQEIRLAVARSMASVLENVVNPALQAYPELEVDEDLWGGIAVARARARAAGVR
jgi:hypothetical protein